MNKKYKSYLLINLIFLIVFVYETSFGQTNPLEFYIRTYSLESGYFSGTGDANSNPSLVYSKVIELNDVPWLQIHFSDAYLGNESYISIKSIQDNKEQRLDAISLQQWNYYSAFFNGSSLEIKIFIAPTDKNIFFKIDELTVGEWSQGTPYFSICGTTDDRIASNQPATARLLNVGCTAWIIPNGKFATAGHCLDGTSATIVQFNVPPSLPNGTLQHPGPEDQYSVISSSKIYINGGVGNDWGVFEVYPNSVTGLMPKQAQDAYWPLVQNLGPPSIRITGYGVDDGSANQTQQTHVGPNAGSSGTTMRYVTDTQGGNSGSPVIDESTSTAVGVHTHGGCTSSGGNNNGTSTYNSAFWTAVDQGTSSADDPTNVSAAPLNDTQINIAFTTNTSNDDVIILWNLTGTFSTPSGSPPLLGQPFAGGTLLYNGTSSPVSHNSLSGSTTYYYKLFSYDGLFYSDGIEVNATTLPAIDFGVNFLISDGCTNSIMMQFGTAAGATDCYDDGLDQWAPPPPPGGAFDGRFVACNEGLFIDIKGTNLDEERIWNIQHQPAEACFPVTLSWNPAELPSGGYFHLVDAFIGTLVNVNMRLNNSYTDVQDLRNLQIKYNYEFCSGYNINDGWNMLSLPLGVANNNYLTLFPSAEVGTLYGYSDGYFTADTIGRGLGYWLKFSAAGQEDVCGSDVTEEVISLSNGWNLIGGPNCNVPLSSVIDPGGIIIPGTLYGYNGGYFTAGSIDAIKAYWIKTSQAGTITISCSSPANESEEEKIILAKETTENFSEIEISDASGNKQTLYFGSKLSDNINIESFSLPPLPPVGSFDVRLTGDYRLSESDEVSVMVQSSAYPLTVKLNNINQNEIEGYVLKEIANGEEAGSQRIEEGREIIIRNKEVTGLRITKEQTIPVTYNLEQNYPNPFNPSTTIKFSLPEAANVQLNIYNTLGQKVAELVNTNLEAGYHSYEWEAGEVASGIYIYELRTDNFTSTKKMVLLR